MNRLQDLFANASEPVYHTSSGTAFTAGAGRDADAGGFFSRRRSSLERGVVGRRRGEGAAAADDIDEVHEALELVQDKISDFYRALCTSAAVQVQSATVDAELQGKLDDIQAALRACRDRINAYEAHTAHAKDAGRTGEDEDEGEKGHKGARRAQGASSRTALLSDTEKGRSSTAGRSDKETALVLNTTQLRMRRNVSTHAKEKLRGLTLRAWAAEDRLRQFRVERTARQLRLRLGDGRAANVDAGEAPRRADHGMLYSDPDTADAKPADRGALEDASSLVNLSDDDYQLLAESVIYAQKDGEVFALTPYDLRQAVERYQAVCQIEEKTRLLHHLYTEMNWLVQEQGETLNEVGKEVDKGYSRARRATEQLRRGKTYNSRCCCGCGCSTM